jgi:hypothetical protein
MAGVVVCRDTDTGGRRRRQNRRKCGHFKPALTHGTAAVETLLKRAEVPMPNYVVNTSPDKWQVIWKVEGFDNCQAEELQRGLARDTGADSAATDCARVMRLPGFYNHKYALAHFVRAESLAAETYRPEQFPEIRNEDRRVAPKPIDHSSLQLKAKGPGTLSQSERDWAYAKRALTRGESPAFVAAAIASFRRYDKHNPRDYAERTVKKAAQQLERVRPPGAVVEPDR